MRTLGNLLEAAVGRAATEVVLESGQPVVFTTARGPEAEKSVLPRTELFDMIVAAVDDAQQVELAVGNPVRFTIQAGASWTVSAEPGIEGIVVRARREGGAPSLEIELDDGPGFAIGGGSFPDDDQFIDLDDDLEPPPPPPPQPRAQGKAPSQLKVEALESPSLQDVEDFSPNKTRARAPEAPFESGTWALAEDEDEFEVGLDEPNEGRLPSGFPDPPPSAYDSGRIGVPEDDDDASSFDPFADPIDDRRRGQAQRSPTLPAVTAAPRTPSPAPASPPATPVTPAMAAPARPRPSGAEMPTRRDVSAAAAPQAETRRELTPLGSPEADTRRELPTVGRVTPGVGELAASIGEGSLVYVEAGLSETLVQSFAAPSVTVDDHSGVDEVWTRIRGLPVGAIVIIRREDPSTLLGWILRRLEEGYRVFVETRARTVEGARRILLGVGATERAERWLDTQVTLVIEPGEGGPRVRKAS
jgi:hypothetical protein